MSDWDEKNVINAREMYSVPKKLEPRIDEPISRKVGMKVFSRDPRLISLIIKWKRQKGSQDSVEKMSDSPDNLLMNPAFVTELKKVFNSPL